MFLFWSCRQSTAVTNPIPNLCTGRNGNQKCSRHVESGGMFYWNESWTAWILCVLLFSIKFSVKCQCLELLWILKSSKRVCRMTFLWQIYYFKDEVVFGNSLTLHERKSQICKENSIMQYDFSFYLLYSSSLFVLWQSHLPNIWQICQTRHVLAHTNMRYRRYMWLIYRDIRILY